MLIDKLYAVVEALNLDLRGKTVLTEAATGPYVVTPVLAALAGAKVYAFTRATRYGSVEEVFEQTGKLISECRFMDLDIQIVDDLTPEMIGSADMITNSGHLRPLNEEKLKYAKTSLVIPLMYEAWEWRDSDIDLAYIRTRGFALGATNERHPDIDVFNYLGDMALKLIYDAGICLYGNRFILICNNDFGPYIAKVLSKHCAGILVIDEDKNRDRYLQLPVEWGGGFPELSIPESYCDSEAIIFSAYPFTREWIGNRHPIDLGTIKKALRDPYLLRYCGDIRTADCDSAGIRYFPKQVPSGHMGVLPSAIGFDPVIRLQAGGLKAGEALMSGQFTYRNLPIVDIL